MQPFHRCVFEVLSDKYAVDHHIEIGMIGKEGLPPTLQQTLRYVEHNAKMLREANHPETDIWELWAESLHATANTAANAGDPSGVITETVGTLTFGGYNDVQGRHTRTECIPSMLIDVQKFDDFLVEQQNEAG